MMALVDMSYCSTNTKRRRMDLSARQKNTSCNDDMIKMTNELWTNSISDEKTEHSVGL